MEEFVYLVIVKYGLISLVGLYLHSPLAHENTDTTHEITRFIGERAKRARHSQVCSIENRIYITEKPFTSK